MIENITIGQIGAVILFLSSFIGSLCLLLKYIKNWIKKGLENEFASINKEISTIKKDVKDIQLNNIKTDLVDFMCNAENNNITTEQKINAYDLYDKYKKLGGNSYIHDKWEKLKKEGDL